MYYKKQGNEPPVIKSGCAYTESYYFDGYLFLKYSIGNTPSEELAEITQEEFEANKPVIPEPEPQPTEQDILQAELLLNQMSILDNQGAQDAVMAKILLGQLEV
ncbi:hypothetical protein CLNEO_07350 [Anaerotignum neopropionicum]|uniref:Uncharacterized protein n=1 Tax=Anaerotignum neopropionicum TaxID=36847 RepID=A0A136WGN2_9FIRM|nr:hypothetical protein [Anaerotignum neopropionicum]KXL53509.1 hypothetical protein CLNEO_07350 [Anaerotignum neopropionicum]